MIGSTTPGAYWLYEDILSGCLFALIGYSTRANNFTDYKHTNTRNQVNKCVLNFFSQQREDKNGIADNYFFAHI